MPTLTTLPVEILSEIFCKLDQKQCVECMAVCRHLYNELPGYTVALWKRFEMSYSYDNETRWDTIHHLMLKCLGPHVTDICLEQVNSYALLYLLAHSCCAIDTLEIISHGGHPFFKRTPFDSPKLVKMIQIFSSTLTQLDLTYHPHDISITTLLELLPNLTHLTVLIRAQTELEDATNVVDDNPLENKLIYLHLDLALDFESRIVPILRRSPGLRTFLLSTSYPGKPRQWDTEFPIDIKRIFTLCPHISSFMWYQSLFFDETKWERVKEWKGLSKTADPECRDGVLRRLKFYGDSPDLEQYLLPVITRSKHTLETMELSYMCRDECRGLKSISLPNLKTLELTYHKFSAPEWITLFSDQWSNLETLRVSMSTVNLKWNPVIEGISTLKNLRSLQLEDYFDRIHDMHTADCRNLSILSRNTRLETLVLKDICLSDHVLLSLNNIRSLKELDITIENHQYCLSEEGIDKFLTSLIDLNIMIPKIFFEAFDQYRNFVFWDHKYFKVTDSQVYH